MNYDEKLLSDADNHWGASDDAVDYIERQLEDYRDRFFGDLLRFRYFLACDPTALRGAVERSLLSSALFTVSEDASGPRPVPHAETLAGIAGTPARFWDFAGEALRDQIAQGRED